MKRVISCAEGGAVYLAGKSSSKGITVQEYGEAAYPQHLQVLEQVEAAVGELTQNFSLKGKKVQIVLPSQGVLFRELYLPTVKNEKQLDESIRNEMLYYHSNIDEYTVTYVANGLKNSAGQNGYFAYALRNATIEGFRKVFDNLGLHRSKITIMADSMAKLTGLCYPEVGLSIVLDLYMDHIELYLVENGCCVLFRRVGMKYETFNGNNEIFAAELADHVGRVLQFQRTRYSQPSVQNVLITGTITGLDTVIDHLHRELALTQSVQVECSPFDFHKKVSLSAKIPQMTPQRLKAAGDLL